MKLYQNGTVFDKDNQVGTHNEDIDGLLKLTDERGTYAPFAAGNTPDSYVSFESLEKLRKAGYLVLPPVTKYELEKEFNSYGTKPSEALLEKAKENMFGESDLVYLRNQWLECIIENVVLPA